MASEIELYVKQMAEVRQRLGLVESVLAGRVRTGTQAFDAELIFIQLRKALELIAFGSLCANKSGYAEVHQNFSNHWKAAKMLDALEKVNPHFYPEPLESPKSLPGRGRHFDRPTDGFMTREEFVRLYDACAEVLHTRNPFREGDPTIYTGYSVAEWVARIQRLLTWHVMHLTDRTVWLIKIPAEGDVQAWPAAPDIP